MQKVRTLAALVIGVVLIAAVYSLAATGRNETRLSFDSDEGHIVRHTISGDRGEFVLRDDDRTIKAEWRGDFNLNDLGTDISSLDDRFEIEFEEDGVKERAEFRSEDDGVRRVFFIDGAEQEDDEETNSAVADLLLRFLRASGIKAAERVAALLDQGGPAAALDEIDLLSGDHAKSAYAVALSEKADLAPAELERLAARLETVESDHDLARALIAILEHENITAETAPALIAAAETIDSDHDLRRLIEALAKQRLDDESLDLALELFEELDGDYDMRVAAAAFLERDALNPSQAARLLHVAGRRLDSDHDLRLVLIQAAPFYARDPEAGEAWLEAFDELRSSHDMRLSLEEAAQSGALDAAQWTALIEASEEIDSSHDQRLALEAIAAQMGRDPALVAAFREAAAKIDSNHDRERALEAIGD